MIPLVLQNQTIFVWNPDDWLTLRKKHRIIGNLVGSLPTIPIQNNFLGLPLLLTKEETALLLEKKICQLYMYNRILPSNETESLYKEYLEKNKAEQVEFIIAEKKRNVSDMIDRIVEGKRKKIGSNTFKSLSQRSTIVKSNLDENKKSEGNQDSNSVQELDRESILKSELERVEQTPLSHHLTQTFVGDPWLKDEDLKPVEDWDFPKSEDECLKFKIFKDLWERGYYITCGEKFGGHYLVYTGDPVLFHSHFIVYCINRDESMSWIHLSARCRIGSSSRKIPVVAFLDEDGSSVKYLSIEFAGAPGSAL